MIGGDLRRSWSNLLLQCGPTSMLGQVAQGHSQSNFECLQGWGFCLLLGPLLQYIAAFRMTFSFLVSNWNCLCSKFLCSSCPRSFVLFLYALDKHMTPSSLYHLLGSWEGHKVLPSLPWIKFFSRRNKATSSALPHTSCALPFPSSWTITSMDSLQFSDLSLFHWLPKNWYCV